MPDDFRVRIGSELDRLKSALEELKRHLETMPLSVSLREDFEYFTRDVRDIDLRNKESLSIGDRFDGLPRDFQDIRRDLEGMVLPESVRQDILLSIRSIEEALQNIKAILWEWGLPVLLAHYEKMWTTEKDDWWLVGQEKADGKDTYVILQVSKQLNLIIEDDEWYLYIIRRMKEAGNRRITYEEDATLFPIDLPEGWTPPPPVQASDFPDETESDDTEH
jgi:hypothetical protein